MNAMSGPDVALAQFVIGEQQQYDRRGETNRERGEPDQQIQPGLILGDAAPDRQSDRDQREHDGRKQEP